MPAKITNTLLWTVLPNEIAWYLIHNSTGASIKHRIDLKQQYPSNIAPLQQTAQKCDLL